MHVVPDQPGPALSARDADRVSSVLLVHGGLWDGVDAEFFWHRTGVVGGLRRRGFEVLAPDRVVRASSWAAEGAWLAGRVQEPVTVIAGSNGCSAAVRLALARPECVERLILAWPATADDPDVDEFTRRALGELGATAGTIHALLSGGTLRGVRDDEFGALTMPVALLPCVPANPVHQRRTVDALRERLPHARELPGCPEPPRPEFRLDEFLAAVTESNAG